MTDVIQSPNFLAFFDTVPTSPIIGAINSVFSGGAVFGSLMGGLTMDRFGRRVTVQIGAFICLIGAILQAAAQNLAMILVGRIFAGWAVGLLSMSVPVYQSECAHPKIRGLIVGLTQQMIGVGFIVSTWVWNRKRKENEDSRLTSTDRLWVRAGRRIKFVAMEIPARLPGSSLYCPSCWHAGLPRITQATHRERSRRRGNESAPEIAL